MRVPPRAALGFGVLAISWAAILVRWADAPPVAIAFWRMALATMILAVVAAALRAPVLRSWRGRDWAKGAAAALLLALHFGFWIASLEMTTVAASVVLVSMQPVFVAVLGWMALGERPHPGAWWGIGLAIVGSAVIAGGDLALDRRALLGDGLALLGAFWISGYYVLARWLRATKDLLPYVTVIYGLTAAWLALGLISTGELRGVDAITAAGGYDAATWAALAGLAVGPTILGHSTMNYALRYLRAYEVNIAVLAEPIGATFLAAWLLGETPGPATLAGGALVLAGILLTLRRRIRALPDEVAVANL